MVRKNADAFTIQIVGVGGQGALTVSKAIGNAAMKKDLAIIISEIHGMAQRGGVVQTTIRLGKTVSPLPFASDMTILLGMEPLEIYRAREQITSETVVVFSEDPIRPVSVSSGGSPYPDVKEIIEEVGGKAQCVYHLSAREKAKLAGNDKTTNIVMLGAIMGTGVLPFTREEMRESVSVSVPKRALEANLKAFDLGYEAVHGSCR